MKRMQWVVALSATLPVMSWAAPPAEPAAPAAPSKPSVATPTPAPKPAAPEAAASSFEVVEGKLCGSIKDREPADEKTSFATGERAWLWLKLKVTGEPMMRLRWSLGGQPVWTMDPVAARQGRLWYYKTIDAPGDWLVEALNAADEVVYKASFTATGEPAPRPAAAPEAEAAAAKPAAEAAAAPSEAGGHFEVVELKIAQSIENRDPVGVATSFDKGTKVYAWVKLNVKDAETQFKMRWSNGDQVVWTSDAVSVKQSPSWRTWLTKTLDAPGNWKVEILDADDKPVSSTEVTVK